MDRYGRHIHGRGWQCDSPAHIDADVRSPRRASKAPAHSIPRSTTYTHATLLLRAGVHPKVVQERLGHSSIAITLDIYSHVAPGMQEDAAARVGAIVFGSS